MICVVAIAFSANAFAMMSGNNGYNNHIQRYDSGGNYKNDYNRGHYGNNYGNFNNRNNYSSRKYNDYNRSYLRDGREHYMGIEDNFRGNYKRNVDPKGYLYRYREDQRYQRD